MKERDENMKQAVNKLPTNSKIAIQVKAIYRKRELYLILAPVLLFYLVFAYKPMYGVIIAFKEFNYAKGIMGSPWVGLKYFEQLITLPGFDVAFKNTLLIALGRIVFAFPAPIIMALVLNEVRNLRMKKFFQTVYTFPHFLSWVILGGIAVNFFSDSGFVNGILTNLGFDKINVLTQPDSFLTFIFASDIWKEMGWGTIIYLATLAGISPELYEAAKLDGANRFKCLVHITWPMIVPTVVILLILNVGNAMNLGGFDQIINTYNAAVYSKSDILDTYIYRRTFAMGASFSSSAAVGLMKSIISCVLLYSANKAAKLMGQEGIL